MNKQKEWDAIWFKQIKRKRTCGYFLRTINDGGL